MLSLKRFFDPYPPIISLMFGKCRNDTLLKLFFFFFLLLCLPIVAATRYAKYPAYSAYFSLRKIFFCYFDAFAHFSAKYAAAFFSTSFSSFKYSFSFCSFFSCASAYLSTFIIQVSSITHYSPPYSATGAYSSK